MTTLFTCTASMRQRSALLLAAVGSIGGFMVAVGAPGAHAAACSDVEVLFARGTGEAPGLGLAGGPFNTSVKANLPGRTVATYAVNYAADAGQTSSTPGSADLTNHLAATAAACPDTQVILGGYSQGATVVIKSLGIPSALGTGTPIPAALASRVKAVVAFGNPLGLQRQTIATASPTYGARSRDICNAGDPVCGAGFNIIAHLAYGTNGTAVSAGAFAAGLVS